MRLPTRFTLPLTTVALLLATAGSGVWGASTTGGQGNAPGANPADTNPLDAFIAKAADNARDLGIVKGDANGDLKPPKTPGPAPAATDF